EALSGRPSDSSTSTAPTNDTADTPAICDFDGVAPSVTVPPVGYDACPPNGGGVTIMQAVRHASSRPVIAAAPDRGARVAERRRVRGDGRRQVIEAAWRTRAVANPTSGGSPAPTGDGRKRLFA